MLSEKGQRVVYWLGAGASAMALPTVNLMPEALMAQADQIRRIHGANLTFPNELDSYEKHLRGLAEISVHYGTLDTYARSLYLQPNKEQELASLKLHLSLFFVLAPIVTAPPPMVIVGVDEYATRYDLDPRYMGWLAVLLGDGLKLNKRVKVISWNYDFQVELALARYCNPGALDQMHERFGIYPGVDPETAPTTDFFLAHLNGIAGQEKRDKSFHAWYKVHAGVFPDWINGLFKAYGDTGAFGTNMRAGFVDRMTFAWEGSEVAQHAIVLAEHALRESDVLVIIGYSFPAFNRLIDNQLITAFDSGLTKKRLIVQNPSATVEDFMNLFELDIDRVSVTVDNNPDQFHLPNELFKS